MQTPLPTPQTCPSVPTSTPPIRGGEPVFLSRRKFLKRAAVAGGALAAPLIIPSSALGLNGQVPPSERILMGGSAWATAAPAC
jgi:hypothetical protein